MLRVLALLFPLSMTAAAQPPPDALVLYPAARNQAHANIRRLRAIEKSGAALTLAQRIELALNYHAAGQHLLFRDILEDCRRTHPNHAEVHFLLARHYGSDVQDWSKAVRYFRAALALSRDARTLAYLANALETEGHPEQALPLYQEARNTAPCHALALTGLARLRQVTATAILACQPRDPHLLGETAKLLLEEGRQADAAHALEQAATAAPRDPAFAYRLYRLYQETGHAEKAKAALARYRDLRATYGTP
jgi:tetratricopeptide (TPR) repeat protein